MLDGFFLCFTSYFFLDISLWSRFCFLYHGGQYVHMDLFGFQVLDTGLMDRMFPSGIQRVQTRTWEQCHFSFASTLLE